MSPFNALKHLVYFEVLADTDEDTEKWNATTAGLVVLRLLDTWYDMGNQCLRTNRKGIKNIRAAIKTIDEKNIVHKVLLGILENIESAKHPDITGILPRLMAYARVLQYEGQFKLSADVYGRLRQELNPKAARTEA
jgi:hypothetical protein